MTDPSRRPVVLFVCVHNAGRSQMAAGFLTELAGDRVDVRSAGSLPADQANPVDGARDGVAGADRAGVCRGRRRRTMASTRSARGYSQGYWFESRSPAAAV